jgi:capsular polysaccharide biosynthesis protein
VIDKDQTVIFSRNGNDGLPARLEAFDDFNMAEDRPVGLATSLVSLAFIRSAIRRATLFWCVLAVVGLVVGIGVNIKFPPAYQASTSVLITYSPDENPSGAVLDNQAIAQSRTVAQMAMEKLGLQGGVKSVDSFAKATTVTVVTERVLQITVSAKTSAEAVSRASAVASAFLQLRASQIETEQKLLVQSLQAQVNLAQGNVASINSKISSLSAPPVSSAQQKQVKNLQGQLTQAQTQLEVDQQTLQDTRVNTGTLAAVTGSVVLDPALPLAHSKVKDLGIYGVTGLILGLAVGMGIIVVQTILSDRLRRRDDVTHALRAPVKLSVGAVQLSRWRPGRRGLAAAGSPDVRRITAYLRAAVPHTVRGTATLAVVAVDDPEVAALSVVSLAISRAREGRKVVVADLAHGAPMASLLDTKAPGVRSVSAGEAQLTLAVPDRDDLTPAGPVGRPSAEAQRSQFTASVTEACASADLLVTLVTLDPSIGAEHVASWATSAVAVVTVGRSSWAKIQGVGEMVRLAGISLASAVLIGADRTDESLGVTERQGALSGPADLRLGTCLR